jgi:LysR family hca operon transcriptional activator
MTCVAAFVTPTPTHRIDSFAMGISLAASIRGFAILPAYTSNYPPWSVVSRPLVGTAPTIDLMLIHHRANSSPVVTDLLGRLGDHAG